MVLTRVESVCLVTTGILGMRADVFGLAQRGVKGTVAAGGSGNFSPRTGAGYVAYKKPDYAHALPPPPTWTC